MKKETSIQEKKGFLNFNVKNKALDPRLASFYSRTKLAKNGGEDDGGKQEVIEFLEQPDYEINNIDSGASIHSNFFLLDNNFVALVKYLKKLKFAVKYVFDNLQPEEIVNEVIKLLQTNKPCIPVSFDIPVEGSRTVVNNNQTYKVYRKDNFIIQITCLTQENWLVDNLMVQVKNNDNVIVYPRIKTFENMIEINFVDKVATNYRVYFI